jgi:prepilin-type N-terminal cleavage/methylation domain-containing protein
VSARAFTLIELIATMVVLAVVASVAAPIMVASSDAYADASDRRESAERVAAALERVVRILREAPATAPGETTPDIVEATASSVELADGVRLELSGSTLLLTTATEAQSPLCQGVSAFVLGFLAADGVTDSSGVPTSTQRVNVRLTAGGVEARTSVFLRVCTGAAS